MNIPEDAIVVASFGFVAPTKLNEPVCRAVARLNREGWRDIYYLMVGSGDYVAHYCDDNIRITGYVGNEDFDALLAAADLVLNLRYPTMGETSAATVHAMWVGKPCVVTDIGWFSELPDDTVIKLDVSTPEVIEEQIYEALRLFRAHRRVFDCMGEAARTYARREHNAPRAAKAVAEALVSQRRSQWIACPSSG
jgi:glycosyltransferase involved in cell wall biosynthesis